MFSGSILGVLVAFHGFGPPKVAIAPETMLVFETIVTASALGATALMARLEGSVLAIPAFALGALLLAAVARRKTGPLEASARPAE